MCTGFTYLPKCSMGICQRRLHLILRETELLTLALFLRVTSKLHHEVIEVDQNCIEVTLPSLQGCMMQPLFRSRDASASHVREPWHWASILLDLPKGLGRYWENAQPAFGFCVMRGVIGVVFGLALQEVSMDSLLNMRIASLDGTVMKPRV